MKNLTSFCCICMQNANELNSLKSTDSSGVKYVEKLKFSVPNHTWKKCYVICKDCTSQLDVVYTFVQCCVDSENFRKENPVEEATNEETTFECDQCSKRFRQKKYLSQHITKVHLNKKKNQNKNHIKEEIEEENTSRDIKTEVNNIILKESADVKEEENKENSEDLVDTKLKDEDPSNLEENKYDPVDSEDLGDAADDPDYFDIEDKYSVDSENEDESLLASKSRKPTRKKPGPKKEPQKCNYCDEIFPKQHDWITHIRTKHSFEKPFACDQCDAKYMNGYSLMIHKRKHTNEKPFICDTCGKSFVSSADLNHHTKIHKVDRAYPCPICDRSFKTHSNLRTHRLQVHLDPSEWKFPCNLCEKKFPIRGNLVKHLKRHAGIKSFSCHICEKKFVNKAELTLHLNTHTNQRLFKCRLCVKEYKNREGLRRHLKVVHDQGNWKAPKTDKKYLCPMCPKVFVFGYKLQRHIFTHTGEKPFECDYCQKRFIDNYGRKVHYKKDHNVEFFG